jgi:hypothetical protein
VARRQSGYNGQVGPGTIPQFHRNAWHAVSFQTNADRMDLPVLKCGVDGMELYSRPTSGPATVHVTPGVIPMIGSSYDPRNT